MPSPLLPSLSRRSSSDANIGGVERLTQQHGRSTGTLNAEAASARLNNESRSNSGANTPTLASFPLLGSSNTTPLLRANNPFNDSSTSLSRPTHGIPETSNAFGPVSSRDSGASNSSGEETSGSSGSEKWPLPAAMGAGSRSLMPSQQSTRRPGIGAIQPLHENSPYKIAAAPMSVGDLGSDYTRYFNPFSDSRRASYVSLGGSRTPLAARSTTNLISPVATGAGASGLSAVELSSQLERADAEKSLLSPWIDDRLVAPFSGKGGHLFPMFADEKEDDDDMHMPYPDDDVKLKPKLRDHFTRGQIVSTIGMLMLLVGLLFIFVIIPVLTFNGTWSFSSGMRSTKPLREPWTIVNNEVYPILTNLRTGLIDPDTPKAAMTKTDVNGEEMVLVFSDEFNERNRTFYPGDDPYWYAPDFWYGATMDLEWYDPDAATTWDGALELRMDQFINHGLNFRSGMLHSWNQLCFKGGMFEVSVSLPGPGGTAGFWPGAWAMGNLGRPGYMATTEGMWPYTYNECDAGITANQSMVDGHSRLPGQRLNSCTCPGEDHPNPGRGRGAPEIDILEASALRGLGVVTQSFQVAPFDIWYYPDYDYTEWPDYGISFPNTWTGGPFQQAVSATSNLNNRWYDGEFYQRYAFEYVPGSDDKAYIAWFVGDQMTFKMNAAAVRPNGNVGQRPVAEEPLSMVVNFGISENWVDIDYAKLVFPAVMRVDYVRWYQPKDQMMVTCDPPGYETTEYIANHPEPYSNPNLTLWNQTGYDWPKNRLVHGCD